MLGFLTGLMFAGCNCADCDCGLGKYCRVVCPCAVSIQQPLVLQQLLGQLHVFECTFAITLLEAASGVFAFRFVDVDRFWLVSLFSKFRCCFRVVAVALSFSMSVCFCFCYFLGLVFACVCYVGFLRRL